MFDHLESTAFDSLAYKKNLTKIVLSTLLLCSCDTSDTEGESLIAPSTNSVFIRAEQEVNKLALLDDEVQAIAELSDTLALISPGLPEGLFFDAESARISGTTSHTGKSEHTVQLQRNGALNTYTIDIHIDPPLPDSFKYLVPGFNVETVVSNAEQPVRMAAAVDGRLFYAELRTGRIRVVHPDTGLATQAFAELDISTGEERGLLGLALDPLFEQNGYVYVHATYFGDTASKNNLARIIRLSDVANQGVNATVLIDQLPAADLHNGGDLVFDRKGHLFVGRGDINNAILAQTDGSTAGRVLRYTKDGGIPADNPVPGNPEWARGLRNTFAMALHPATGVLIGADAGPANNDKLQFLTAGKNFLWGMDEEPSGSNIGYSIRIWPEVITPTALLFHSGGGGYSAYKHQLFLSSYNDEDVRIIYLTGDSYTDFVREETFAVFEQAGSGSKPLHMVEAVDGSLFISTFNSIYRVYNSNYQSCIYCSLIPEDLSNIKL